MQANFEEDIHTGYLGMSFAPANFQDADARAQHSIAPVITNISLSHLSESNDKQQQAKLLKRKVREIISAHQERTIQYFTKPVPADHPLNVANTLLTKYGKILTPNSYDPSRPQPQFLKDYLIDVSGQGIEELNVHIAELEKSRASDTPLQRISSITKGLLDYMKVVGDELIMLDTRLQNECILLDMVADKVLQLTSLDTPDIDGFQEMMEIYVNRQFEKYQIESLYWNYIYTVQKYSALRDIMTSQRIMSFEEPMCCVCMSEPVVIAFNPCGHTFCTNCSKRTVSCHVCRQIIQSRLRVFFT